MFNHAPADYINPFKKIAEGDFKSLENNPEDVFFCDELITALIPTEQWPNNPGNVIIVPNEAYENIYDIPDDLLAYIHIFSKKVAIAMKETYKCDGISIRQHNEPAGNQEVWHYHLHVFPRYDGDNLYIQHEEKKPSTPEDRSMYAEKLRTYFKHKN